MLLVLQETGGVPGGALDMILSGGIAAVISMFVLIFFIHHTARAIEASSVIASVVAEIDEEIIIDVP